MEGLSLEEKIGQMLVVGFHGTTAPLHIIQWLNEGRIGGVILFARNITTPRQVHELTQSLHKAAKHPILIAIDQEGGTVARLREGYTESPGAMALGAADDPMLTQQVSAILGTELRALGVNWNLAPAIDITHNIDNPSVGTRSIGSDPEHVARHAKAQVTGFQKAGVAATAKHYPGKANTPVDPHVELPVITGDLDQMWNTDLVPFKAAIEANVTSILITHVQFRDIEPTYSSTLSPRIIQGLLREKMGYRGLVTTDCMEMKAVTNKYGPGESAVLAAIAGANIILFSHTREYQEQVYTALLEAAKSGRIPLTNIDYSIERIKEVKQRYPAQPQPPLEVIRQPSHLETTKKAARAAIVPHRIAPNTIPIDTNASWALIEYASHIEQETLTPETPTQLAHILKKHIPNLHTTWLDPKNPTNEQLTKAKQLTDKAQYTILATRNAHITPNQQKTAEKQLPKATILLCLRNPYDAANLNCPTTLLTLGDSQPSLQAAADALTGSYTPKAKLRVPLTME
ncbi:MAG: beta-N-acetylhexosaminidase [Candidatus Bathyarchaeota archaeon]|nr:beta-N-acetylhexosaminidase [Candidatus Bathyarchaeota archaeon]